jgi:hypothetical protein
MRASSFTRACERLQLVGANRRGLLFGLHLRLRLRSDLLLHPKVVSNSREVELPVKCSIVPTAYGLRHTYHAENGLVDDGE